MSAGRRSSSGRPAERASWQRERDPGVAGNGRRASDAAARLLRDGDSDFAASRAYYGYFYTAQALLLAKGLEFSRHGQVIAQYGLHFAKTAEVDPRFHRLLDRAFVFRQRADYNVTAWPDPDLVEELIREGLAFVAAAEDFLARAEQRQG